jgi:hypothetical protein
MTIRSISAQTGIPLGAVHRAKRQIEKKVARQAGQRTAAVSLQPPPSYVVQQDINGVRHDVRRLSISVYERAVRRVVERGLLSLEDREDPWAVTSALFAGMFNDHTIQWLHKRGLLAWNERSKGERIAAAVNDLILLQP